VKTISASYGSSKTVYQTFTEYINVICRPTTYIEVNIITNYFVGNN